MKMKVFAAILAVAVGIFVLAPTTALAAPPPRSGLTVPLNGTISGQPATILYTINQFAVQNNQLVAIGTVTGTLQTATGTITKSIGGVVVPVSDPSGSCPILHLTLGPINLDLLGLQVSTNQIVLDITAQSGPGNLLGNLLCDVANLLNTNGPLSQIANLLNQILANL